VAIVRQVFRREGPVAHDGSELALPYTGPGSIGAGRPLKSILHMNPDLPIFLATGGPANVRLTAEVANGWLPLGYTPGSAHLYADDLALGLERGGRTMADLEVQVGVTVRLTDDVAAVFDAARPGVAMRVGGYGPSLHNFHRDAMSRRGFGEAADRITELFAAGLRDEAAAAVPDDYLDDGALVGSRQRIAGRFEQWRSTLATGLTVRPTSVEEMELLVELAGCEPRPDVEVPPGPAF
jgi:alkanesulfonate monooxygenase SsuD/methylene tetrahydromethanopterin reductase-like flavin-dependent oxidoreductase (luciferase family)